MVLTEQHVAFVAFLFGAANTEPRITRTSSKVNFETAKANCGNNLVEFHDPAVKQILAEWLDGEEKYSRSKQEIKKVALIAAKLGDVAKTIM